MVSEEFKWRSASGNSEGLSPTHTNTSIYMLLVVISVVKLVAIS
jgi:hypothetical protein